MNNNNTALNEIAKSAKLSAEVLLDYLHERIDPVRKEVLVSSRLTDIEMALTGDDNGVFFCLLRKSTGRSNIRGTSNAYIFQILKGIHQYSSENSYELQYRFNHKTLATTDYFQSVLDQNPDASMIMLISQGVSTFEDVCEERGRHCVALDYNSKGKAYTLNVDSYSAVCSMTRRLIELGHRRIAFITGNLDTQSAVDRLAGYRQALEVEGIPVEKSLIKHGNWQIHQAYRLTQELLNEDHRPTAIVCSNDLSALGAYDAILSEGLSIPDDISVVGFDDIPMASQISPMLTTIRQPLVSMGRNAASMLIQAMEGNAPQRLDFEQPLEIKWRESVAEVANRNH